MVYTGLLHQFRHGRPSRATCRPSPRVLRTVVLNEVPGRGGARTPRRSACTGGEQQGEAGEGSIFGAEDWPCAASRYASAEFCGALY